MDSYIEQQNRKEQEYAANRMKKAQADKAVRMFFWIQLAVSALIFGTAFFAGALSSQHDTGRGWTIFSNAMGVGFIQIALAVVTLALGFVAASGRRPALYVLTGGYLALFFWMLLSPGYPARFFNLIVALFGVGLTVWLQRAFSTDEELQKCPGYPSFQLYADRAEYHPSAVVTARQASDHMESVGGAAEPVPEKERAVLTASADTVLDTIREPERQKQAEALTVPDDVSLRRFADEEASAGRAAEEIPQLSPEGILEEMTAEGSGHRQSGDPSMLPDPEEVRARLAAMRDKRNGQASQ